MNTPSPALLDLLKLEEQVSPPQNGSSGMERFIFEKYLEGEASGGWKLKAYYALRPFIPRPVQLMLRKNYKAKQEARTFPRWPIETTVTDMVRETILKTANATGREEVFRLSMWPNGKKFAFVITHDVEWDSGLAIAPKLAEIEKRHGFTSSWNLVPERYPIDWKIVDGLRAQGFEIGVHGLKHDGKDLQSHRTFQSRLVKIHEYARQWGAVGFRSPATLRNLEWMPELRFEYDSSYFDTDPYEPQPGGCCSIWPFFIGDLLEMPMTMPQDHTLFEILGHKDIDVWKKKADWIAEQGGMILINVHPDYMNTDERLGFFEEFLTFMKGKEGMWHAQPKDVARWWKDRTKSTLTRKNDSLVIEGPAASTGSVLKTKVRNGMLLDTPA
jgi:hypothetical protein